MNEGYEVISNLESLQEYRDFIAKCATRELTAEYFEKHHIVPRSLGGGDEPENIIRLTWHEHKQAHSYLVSGLAGTKYKQFHFLMKYAYEKMQPMHKDKTKKQKKMSAYAKLQGEINSLKKENLMLKNLVNQLTEENKELNDFVVRITESGLNYSL